MSTGTAEIQTAEYTWATPRFNRSEFTHQQFQPRSIFLGPEKNDIIGNTITNTYEALEYNGSWTFSTPAIVRSNHIINTFGDAMYLYSVNPHSGGSIIASDNVIELASTWLRSGICLVLAHDIIVERNIIKNGYGNGIWIKTKNNYVPPRLNSGST